jgi:hypothetical protein
VATAISVCNTQHIIIQWFLSVFSHLSLRMFWRTVKASLHIRGFYVRLSFEKRDPTNVKGLLYYVIVSFLQCKGKDREEGHLGASMNADILALTINC